MECDIPLFEMIDKIYLRIKVVQKPSDEDIQLLAAEVGTQDFGNYMIYSSNLLPILAHTIPEIQSVHPSHIINLAQVKSILITGIHFRNSK